MPLALPWQRFAVVAAVWELWHVPMRIALWQADAMQGLMIAGGTLVISLLAGYAVLRTRAVAFGVSAIITTQNTVDAYSPKVIRASAGLVFRIPVGLPEKVII